MIDNLKINKLIKQSLNGNQKAMRTLFDFLTPSINYTCKRYLSDPEEINDAVQETMISVFSKLKTFNPEKGNLEAWVYRISTNNALQIIRSNKRHPTESIDNVEVEDINFEFDQQLNANEVIELINQLEGNYKLVFNLFYIEGYSHKEIAKLIDVKESTSRMFYFRAKKKLSEIYSDLY